MEYETEGESALFDESTNPSLDGEPAQAPKKAEVKSGKAPDPKTAQKAEHIPDEEPQAQMS